MTLSELGRGGVLRRSAPPVSLPSSANTLDGRVARCPQAVPSGPDVCQPRLAQAHTTHGPWEATANRGSWRLGSPWPPGRGHRALRVMCWFVVLSSPPVPELREAIQIEGESAHTQVLGRHHFYLLSLSSRSAADGRHWGLTDKNVGTGVQNVVDNGNFKQGELVRTRQESSVWARLPFAELESPLQAWGTGCGHGRAPHRWQGGGRAVAPPRRPPCPPLPAPRGIAPGTVLRHRGTSAQCQRLDISSWRAKSTLLRTNLYKAHLTEFGLYFCPFAWNSSVISLSLVWSRLFLYWLIQRYCPGAPGWLG